MSGRNQGSAPERVGFSVWVPVAVRYSDLDQQGHVNNAVYFTYFEQGRIGYFDTVRRMARDASTSAAGPLPTHLEGASAGRSRVVDVAPGATDDRLELPLVVSEANCTYRRPIASLASLSVGVRAARIAHASIVLEYAICAESNGSPYATGGTTVVCVDLTSGRPRGLPAWTLAALRQLEARAGVSASGAEGVPS